VKLLLAQNMLHLPSYGGANKASRLMMERLASLGHECHVVAPLGGLMHRQGPDDLVAYLRSLGAEMPRTDTGAVCYRYQGVQVSAVRSASALAAHVRSVTIAVEPDWVLVPSDDPGRLLAYTIQQLPVGPRAFYPSRAATEMLRRVAGVVTISRAAQDYLYEYAGIRAYLHYPQVYGDPPRRPVRTGPGSIAMVNPCRYKGIDIFLQLTDLMPERPFLAVPTWGASEADRAALRQRRNIEVIAPQDGLGELLRRVGTVVMPSLWDETFGFTSVEAMLYGVPVVASEVGGLVEAKLGVPYLVPVRPIEVYDAVADPARPVPAVPAQDIQPWLEALHELDDPDRYREVSQASRAAALGFVGGLDDRTLEDYLADLPVASEATAGARAV
jgi:glycosyltransferase involved in cell wall biosynthesis